MRRGAAAMAAAAMLAALVLAQGCQRAREFGEDGPWGTHPCPVVKASSRIGYGVGYAAGLPVGAAAWVVTAPSRAAKARRSPEGQPPASYGVGPLRTPSLIMGWLTAPVAAMPSYALFGWWWPEGRSASAHQRALQPKRTISHADAQH